MLYILTLISIKTFSSFSPTPLVITIKCQKLRAVQLRYFETNLAFLMIHIREILAISSIGLAIHGFVFCVYVVSSKKRTPATIIYSSLLLIVSIILVEYFVSFYGLSEGFPHLIAVKIPLLFLIGPVFYLFLRMKSRVSFKHWEVLHLAPFILVFLMLLPYYVLPSVEKFEVAESSNGFLTRMGYLVASIFHLMIYLFFAQKLRVESKNHAFKLETKALYIGFTGLVLAYVLGVLLTFFGNQTVSMVRFCFLLGLGILLNSLGYSFIRYPKSIVKAINGPSKEIDLIAKQIKEYFFQEKPFLKPGFGTKEVAEALGTNVAYISKAMNQVHRTNFVDFTNQCRIEEAKDRLKKKNEKVFAVALESGFTNKNTFIRVFKKYTGLTPTEYRNS